jgi:heme oxygenase
MTTAPAPTGIMGRLKSETAELHAVAEAKPLEEALIGGSINHDQYKKYLEQRWVVHRELEAATDKALGADPRLERLGLPGLYQTANIEADLAHLGADTASIQAMKGSEGLLGMIRGAGSTSVLMGIFYVFEGSKNGARYIAKSLAKAWGKSDLSGMKYLDPHGEAQRGLWMKFREDMNSIEWSTAEQDAMVEAAKETFRAISALDDEIHAG